MNFVAFIVGIVFAVGLGISGMTQPAKVVGFLDVFGVWDPSLMFVMVGAIGVHMVTYHLVRKRKTPVLAAEWHVPLNREITNDLILGAFIFGIGWGLAGYCPGPAIVSLATFEIKPVIFVLCMLVGMYAFKYQRKK